MTVITLSRQFGAGGGAIGRELARRLGADYLDRELVARVAARAGLPEDQCEGYDERLPGLWQRLATALSASTPELVMPSLAPELPAGLALDERLLVMTRAVIEEAAAGRRAVIVGRGAAFLLRDRPGVLRVHLHASLDDRVQYLRAQVDELPRDARPDEASLRELCRSVDHARARYLRSHYDVDWNDLRHYDLALDTGRLGLGRCIDLIERAARDTSSDAASATAPARR